MIALSMGAVYHVLLLVTLFQRNIHLVMSDRLKVCSDNIGDSCLTLTQLASNQTILTSQNTTLILDGGDHNLATGIAVSNVAVFAMASNGTSGTISCSHKGVNMTFSNISEVHISGLKFFGCGGSTVNSVSSLMIEDSQFIGNNGSATSVLIRQTIASIKGTNFSFNTNGSYREHFSLIPSSAFGPDLGTTTAGGALIVFNSNLTIGGCHFDGNSANVGGAVFIESESTVFIMNSVFNFNHATDCHHAQGGALFIKGMSKVDISNTAFENNKSDQHGGIIYAVNATLIISNSCISENNANNNGGAVITENIIELVLNTTRFEENKANQDGGAVYLSDSLGNSSVWQVVVYNCSFTRNEAHRNGGAIFNRHGDIQINSCRFISSFAGSSGGALTNAKFSTTFVVNSTFRSNSAQTSGGVISTESNCTFVESVFINNTAANHGGVAIVNKNILHVCNSSFHHNWANKGGVFHLKPNVNLIVDNSTFNGSIHVYTGAVIFAREGVNVNLIKSNFTSNLAHYGGVLTATKNNNISIEDCVLLNNTALSNGGVIFALTGCTLLVAGSKFLANRAVDNGIVYISDSSTITAEHSSFVGNAVSHNGGALHLYDDSVAHIHCCTFDSNRAENSGGAIYGRNNATILVNDSSMRNNSAQTSGGGIHIQRNCHVIIESSNFTNNTADYGGVIHVYVFSIANIFSSHFMENRAKISGGALTSYKSSDIFVEECKFSFNTAGTGGVSTALQDPDTILYYCNHLADFSECDNFDDTKQNTLTFIESEFWHNKAYKSGILYAQGSIINVTNSVFCDNVAEVLGGGMFATEGSIITIYATNFTDNDSKYKGGVY